MTADDRSRPGDGAIDGGPPLVVDAPAEGVRRLRLNRPEVRNAIDAGLLDALHMAFDGDEVRSFVLSSVDPQGLSSGIDLRMDTELRRRSSDRLYHLYRRMLEVPAPIVCVVRGLAVGAGVQLALASDLRIGGITTRVRFVGPAHGLAVGVWALPSLIGRGRTLDLCLRMRTVGAADALGMGLLDHLSDDPDGFALEIATAIAALDADAAAAVKRLTVAGSGVLSALEAERERNAQAWSGSINGLEWSDRQAAGGRD